MTKRQKTLVVLTFIAFFSFFTIATFAFVDIIETNIEAITWLGVGTAFIFMLMALDFILEGANYGTIRKEKNLMEKEIKKAVSKSKRLELWEQINLTVEELKEKTDLRYLECELKRAEKELKKFKEKIAELKKEIKPIWFIPEKDDIFYYVDTYGNVRWKIADFYSDNILKHNQVFKTKEEALDYFKYKKAEVAIKKRIAELNKGWKPDWEDKSEDKCYVFYDTNTKFLIWCDALADKKLPDAMYLKSWKLAKQLIDELKSELLLFFKY